MRRRIENLIVLGVLIISAISSSAKVNMDLHNKKRVVEGPNGVQIVFEQPVFEEEIYADAYILKQGQRICTIEKRSHEGFDGLEAQDRLKDKRGGILWSLDGDYIVLKTWRRDGENNDQWDLKHEYLAAYSTKTGHRVTFKSATSALGNDTFLRWSPSKPDAAVILGNDSNEEEAYPILNDTPSRSANR